MAHASVAAGTRASCNPKRDLKSFSKKHQAADFRKKSECLVPILEGKDERGLAQSETCAEFFQIHFEKKLGKRGDFFVKDRYGVSGKIDGLPGVSAMRFNR